MLSWFQASIDALEFIPYRKRGLFCAQEWNYWVTWYYHGVLLRGSWTACQSPDTRLHSCEQHTKVLVSHILPALSIPWLWRRLYLIAAWIYMSFWLMIARFCLFVFVIVGPGYTFGELSVLLLWSSETWAVFSYAAWTSDLHTLSSWFSD